LVWSKLEVCSGRVLTDAQRCLYECYEAGKFTEGLLNR
jgi:hypothetical protein